jgi:hypothetical protein
MDYFHNEYLGRRTFNKSEELNVQKLLSTKALLRSARDSRSLSNQELRRAFLIKEEKRNEVDFNSLINPFGL